MVLAVLLFLPVNQGASPLPPDVSQLSSSLENRKPPGDRFEKARLDPADSAGLILVLGAA